MFGLCFGLKWPTFMYFELQRSINDLANRDLGQNFAHFGRFEGSLLTILAVKKSISRLFQSCFGLVWEVFGLCFLPQRVYFFGVV